MPVETEIWEYTSLNVPQEAAVETAGPRGPLHPTYLLFTTYVSGILYADIFKYTAKKIF